MTDPVRDPMPDPIDPVDPAAPDPAAAITEPLAPPLDPAAATDPALQPTDPAASATPDAPAAASPFKSRRLHLLAGIRWLVARTFAIALFLGGVAIGYGAFVADQPPPIVTLDPAVDGTVAPAVVTEFIAALGTNDAAALRSAVPPEAYQLLIAEMGRWDFQSVQSVETLATFVDGPRTATELVMTGLATDGAPVSVNLVVHVDGGQIASFR